MIDGLVVLLFALGKGVREIKTIHPKHSTNLESLLQRIRSWGVADFESFVRQHVDLRRLSEADALGGTQTASRSQSLHDGRLSHAHVPHHHHVWTA